MNITRHFGSAVGTTKVVLIAKSDHTLVIVMPETAVCRRVLLSVTVGFE